MRRNAKPIRGKILLRLDAPESDVLYGRWHRCWRLPKSSVTAFYFRGDGVLKPTWYASWDSGGVSRLRAFPDKHSALNYKP